MEVKFLSVDGQIEKLKDDGLAVNEENDKETLRRINYFTLVNRYKFLFIEIGTKGEKFNKGTRFDELLSVYEMDSDLKILIFDYILKLEKMFSTAIAYYFCEAHPEDDVFAYLRECNYEFDFVNREPYRRLKKDGKGREVRLDIEIDDLIHNFFSELSVTSNESINRCLEEKEGKVPLWVLINSLSLGDLSNIFIFMKKEQKEAIIRYLNGFYNKQYNIKSVNDESKLEDIDVIEFLEHLKVFRNICAHNGGLIGKTMDYIKIKPKFALKDMIRRQDTNLGSLVSKMKGYLTKDDYKNLTKNINNIFKKYRKLINKKSFDLLLDVCWN